MTTHCTQASIAGLLGQLHERGTAHIERDGKALTKRAQMHVLRAAHLMGMTHFPACENVDRLGKCQGHEQESSHAKQ